ncbi:hypothetical protein MD484_g982, partial [Candolleomyces efflorescens]
MVDSFVALSIGIGLALAWAAKAFAARRRRNPRGLPLPPGPKGLPLLGNLLQFPQANPWEGYHKLCEKYGDVIYLKAPGHGILVLDYHRRAVDLLDQRSANYSDRMVSPIVELMDLSWSFGLMPYGPLWRQHNRTFHRFFSTSGVQQFYPILYEETNAFLRKVKSQPKDIFEDIQFLFGATLMRMSYGFDDAQRNEELVNIGAILVSRFSDAVVPGRLLVGFIPALKYIPSWFPGAGFQKILKNLAHLSFKTVHTPFEEAKSNLVRPLVPFEPFQVAHDASRYYLGTGREWEASQHCR